MAAGVVARHAGSGDPAYSDTSGNLVADFSVGDELDAALPYAPPPHFVL